MNTDASLANLPGIGARFAVKLKKLGIESIRDLLYHFPFRYEDFSEIYTIADLEPGQQATIRGVVKDVELRRTWRRHMTVVVAVIEDDSGAIRATWFNQPYVKNVLRPGAAYNFSGKVATTESDRDLYLSHPAYERAAEGATKHTARLVPIYPETAGLTSRGIRFLIQPILERLPVLDDWIPPEALRAHRLPDLRDALRAVHFPRALEDAMAAKRRFAFEDLFLLQLANLREKATLRARRAPRLATDIEGIKRVIAELPFPLTLSQKRSLWEIIKDIGTAVPMNRLLQGDVGSGKTVVAALSAMIAVENGYQAAFMAPTEVLARQHYETCKSLFARLRDRPLPTLALLTAGGAKIHYESGLESETAPRAVREAIARGEAAIAVGTHALIAPSGRKKTGVAFKRLGLVIVDEQHRFGVAERARLARRRGGGAHAVPHFLSMSATPIPRTLMLTLFGNLDVSTISELPAGRKDIVTKIVMPLERPSTYEFVRNEIKNGRQVFVICPRIAASDPESADAALELKSVEEEYEKLSKKIFPEFSVAMLHGQMKPKEKESIMRHFREGDVHILVATSVVEVGVDVPNASVMMIEGSDRFGLAQLYQLRGRVGRGAHASYCFLFTDSDAKAASERLKAIVEAKSGFELAEKDLSLRGPGEFLGNKQTGLPDYAMRGIQDVAIIKMSRAAAMQTLRDDPTLARHPLLNAKIAEFEARLHKE